jgi:hypothetical protein
VLTPKWTGTHRKAQESWVSTTTNGTYFLTQVWGPANCTGRQLYKSRAEVELENQRIEKEIAVLRPQD